MEAAGATGTKGEGDVKKHRVTLGDQIALTSLEFKNNDDFETSTVVETNEDGFQRQPDAGCEDSGQGMQWKSIISSLLLPKNKKNKDTTAKDMRRLSTFPPTLPTCSSENSSSSKPKKTLRRRLTGIDDKANLSLIPDPSLLVSFKPSWRNFDYQELVEATDNFCSERVIGVGGQALVYRGCLSDGQMVAVKKLMKKDSEEERISDFLTELGIIAHVSHPNAACLLGFGVTGGLHLVLKLSPQGSVDSRLHDSKEKLPWLSRYKIALGVARGLLYLHEGCHRRIIHRDIKASNILLTDEYDPQISDFGLAKWLPDQWTHLDLFPIEGTFGYMSPEYFMHGMVSEKSDVFAFGVVLLELITGRPAVDSDKKSLVIWAKPKLEANDFQGLVDPSLGDDYDKQQMDRLISVAAICVDHMSEARPIVKEVIPLLVGEQESDGIMVQTSKCDEEDDSTALPNYLDFYKQAALEP